MIHFDTFKHDFDDKPRISTGFWGTSWIGEPESPIPTPSRCGWCHQRTAPGGCWGCHVRGTWWFRNGSHTAPVSSMMISFSVIFMIFQSYAYQRLWIFSFFLDLKWWYPLRYGDGSKPPAMAWGWVLAMDSWRKMMHQWHQWRWPQCAELAAVSSIRCRTLGSHFLKDI